MLEDSLPRHIVQIVLKSQASPLSKAATSLFGRAINHVGGASSANPTAVFLVKAFRDKPLTLSRPSSPSLKPILPHFTYPWVLYGARQADAFLLVNEIGWKSVALLICFRIRLKLKNGTRIYTRLDYNST